MARLPPRAGRSRPRGVFAKAPEAGLRGPAVAGSGLSGLARVMDVIVLFRPWGWTTRAGWEGLFTRGNECRQPWSSWERLVPGWDVWGRKTVSHGELPAIWWWVCSARLWSGIQAGTLWETPWGHTGPLRSAVGYSVSFPNPMGSWGSAVLGMLWGGGAMSISMVTSLGPLTAKAAVTAAVGARQQARDSQGLILTARCRGCSRTARQPHPGIHSLCNPPSCAWAGPVTCFQPRECGKGDRMSPL